MKFLTSSLCGDTGQKWTFVTQRRSKTWQSYKKKMIKANIKFIMNTFFNLTMFATELLIASFIGRSIDNWCLPSVSSIANYLENNTVVIKYPFFQTPLFFNPRSRLNEKRWSKNKLNLTCTYALLGFCRVDRFIQCVAACHYQPFYEWDILHEKLFKQ